MSLGSLSLVIGGARSGKSRFAEGLVLGTGRRRFYIATAEAWDEEMERRIAEHRADRGDAWVTLNAPLDVVGALGSVPEDGVGLVDCATLWLSNHLLAGHDVKAEGGRLLVGLAGCRAPIVVVSNEVGLSIVPENELARAFRDAQGRLNQELAAQAGLVVAVWAGLPLVLKGALPRGMP